MKNLFEQQGSVMISTLSPMNVPEISYAPFYKTDDKVYLYLSEESNHYVNMIANPICSIMAIDDESSVNNIYFRKRISFECDVEKIDDVSSEIETAYANRNGVSSYEHIKNEHYFGWFVLTLKHGRLVEHHSKVFDLTRNEQGGFEKTKVTFRPHKN